MKEYTDYDLSGANTFRMKVRCARYIQYDNAKELESIDWDSLPRPVRHIGGGSNLLFTGDFPGTLLHSGISYVKYVDMGFDDVPVMAGAGVRFDDFVENVCRNGLWGAENLSGIPGEVGAAAVQNIGAYGVEVKDIIKGVVCFDTRTRSMVKFQTCECDYGYRDSLFKHSDGRYIVTAVLFRVSRVHGPRLEYKGVRESLGLGPEDSGESLTPMQVREAVMSLRNSKLPDPEVLGSAGSYFKNPVVDAVTFARVIDIARREFGADVTVPHFILGGGMVKIPAAWLIDRCGLKGVREGGAAVYERQPLVIVNASGSATPSDVLALETRVIAGVRNRFGIELHPEVEHL
ncbi:MAG: UDP-N-acetylmuramate dehydrogenase [Bacteroidales bacterium]|nr:UDP-N-acetylmuramate dehydrogenase [Bacteroidales bacterium]